MPDVEHGGLATALRKVPGQLLLALVNATALLVIVAAVLTLIACSRVVGLASTVASTMTEAVFSRMDVDPKEALTKLERSDSGNTRIGERHPRREEN